MTKQQSGFTLIEIVVVLVVLGLLATITYSYGVPKYRERTYYTRSIAELNTMQNAMQLYIAKYNDYPPDVSRDVPADMKEFIQGQYSSDWPDAPFPGSVYDYDNWPADAIGPEHTYQISIRMCDPGADAVCKATANKYLKGYADDDDLAAWDSYSSMYICLRGSCRSHQSRPMNHPGYCINCGNKSNIF